MSEKQFYVYMLASKTGGTLYIGVTSNLKQRVYQHREELTKGFTKKYQVKKLVWFEVHANAEAAITREKQMKEWKRAWKVKLIETANADWHDLFPTL